MARCKCDPDQCSCNVRAGSGINISGTGSRETPWVISAIPNCVNCAAPGNPGDVLTRQADGTYLPVPPADTDACVDCGAAANVGDTLFFQTDGQYRPGPPAAAGPQGPAGPAGPEGPQGPPGESVQIKGQVGTSSDLIAVSSPAEGDGFITADSGHLWVFTGPAPNDSITKWTDVGQIVGPPGPTGQRGSLWYTGSGAPTAQAGELPHDMYLDVISGDVYTLVA